MHISAFCHLSFRSHNNIQELHVTYELLMSSSAAAPNLFCSTDRLDVRQYFHGPGFKVWLRSLTTEALWYGLW